MLKQDGEDWVLYTKDGKKELFRNKDKSLVEQREREIEHFASKAEIDIVIKATQGDDGVMRWKSSVSTTALDRQDERTSIDLYKSWIEAIENGSRQTWLPPARNPFLGIAHYPSLDGKGEAGLASVVYIDGKCCKAKGIFNDTPIGKAMFEALRREQSQVQKGETVEKPIRISAGWYDESHLHESENFTFERKSLTDKCPLCEKGIGGKVYLKGQLDHFAATRVPVNPETNLLLEEKSMTEKATRKSDAESIIGTDLAELLETEVNMTNKSDAIVIKSLTKKVGDEEFEAGDFLIVEDPEKVTTWHLAVKRQGKVDHNLMGAAKAALTVGFRGNVYEGPNKQDAIDKLKKLYETEGMTWKADSSVREAEQKEEAYSSQSGGLNVKQTETKMKKTLKYKGVEYVWDIEEEKYMDADGNEAPPAALKMVAKQMDEDAENFEDEEDMVVRPKVKAKKTVKSIISYAEAKSMAQENEDEIGPLSAWDVFKSAVETAFEQKDPQVQLLTVKSLIEEFDADVESIKSQVADAYLGYIEHTPEVEKSETDPNDITLQLKAQVDSTLKDASINVTDKEVILQKALTNYVGQLKSILHPIDTQKAELATMEQMVDSKLNPVIEKLNLIAEQMTAKSQVSNQVVPVQKSLTANTTMVNENKLPISPITGKPSALTAMIQRSVR